MLTDYVISEESLRNVTVPPGDHDYMLNSDSELQPLIYLCTVCKEHFMNHASFLRHSCVEQVQPKSLDENKVQSILTEHYLNADTNKMLLNINEENSTQQNFKIIIEEAPLNKVLVVCSTSEENNISSVEILNKESSSLEQNKTLSDKDFPIPNYDTNDPPEIIASDISIIELGTTTHHKPKRKFLNHNILCSGCGKFFRGNYYLTHHACGKPPSNNPLPRGALGKPPYKCKCGITIHHKSSYCRHIHHECKLRKVMPVHEMYLTRPTQDLEGPPYRCKNCGTVLKRKFALSKHLEICGVPNQHPCKLCEKKFKTVSRLKIHMHNNHNVCSLCDSLFNTFTELDEHQKTEHEQCPLCKTPFNHKADLEKHVQKSHLSV